MGPFLSRSGLKAPATIMSLGEAKLRVPPALELYLKENRLATFSQWPFDSDCSCTAVRMADAGFIHCPVENASDVAQCFICFKELEGWEPDDDPMEEHRKHSPKCAFLALQKDICDLTVQEFMKLRKERMNNLIEKEVKQAIIEVEKYANLIRGQIDNLRS
ncbi:baculoviral IAP repeat-containing protein 5 [Protobothrops mucrosquamatus]|uniref:baculoviral IAP repeat-containing protein 5 n=1 Tax=Protobothrops mucrosquamatus TaxID=103944 RepID=UPI000775FD0B|nr:baculoviral IAP repeat-containing protein 5 [Protobothrops mucrosquamatus]